MTNDLKVKVLGNIMAAASMSVVVSCNPGLIGRPRPILHSNGLGLICLSHFHLFHFLSLSLLLQILLILMTAYFSLYCGCYTDFSVLVFRYISFSLHKIKADCMKQLRILVSYLWKDV